MDNIEVTETVPEFYVKYKFYSIFIVGSSNPVVYSHRDTPSH